LTDPIFCHD
jgi:cytochrome P450